MRTRRRKLWWIVLAGLIAGCGGPTPDHARGRNAAAKQAPAVREIDPLVASVLEAYGGLEALEEVDAYRCEGRITLEHGNNPAETVRWFEYPDRLRIEMRHRDRGDLRIVRGDTGWTGPDDLNLVPLGNEFFRSTYLQMVRMGLPLRLAEADSELVELDPDPAGRLMLRLPVSEDMSLDCHIDPRTRRIEAVTMNLLEPEPVTMMVELSEFRWVDGVLFPFREDAYTGEARTATVRYRSVEVNPVTPGQLFTPVENF